MPVRSGLDVAMAVRAVRSDIPILLCSGYITEALRERARPAGVGELLGKPATLEELGDALSRVLLGELRA